MISELPMVFAGDFATKELTGMDYLDYYTELKRIAFQRTVHDFYQERELKSWQHVISIGDGIFEFVAVAESGRRPSGAAS